MLSNPHPSQHKQSTMVITIDGPAGAGKSTVAKRLARILNIFYLDTGAMYRGLTCKAMKFKVNLEDEEALVKLAKSTKIDLVDRPDGLQVLVDGQDVTENIRTVDVTNNTFYIARAAGVREIMVNWQLAMGKQKSIIAEGRDLGTVVFPQATYKFYLDADVKERTKRRFNELQEKGKGVEEKIVMEELKDRDHKDYSRKVGPLCKAQDAVVLDTTHLSVDETVAQILKHIKTDGPITHS